jgi:hypothetical protein
MSPPSDDDRIGYGQPPRNTRWKKGQSGNSRRKPKPPENTVSIIDRLLVRRIQITLNGEQKKATALEVIVYQLMQKAKSGSGRAFGALLKYQAFATLNLEKKVKLIFVESDYTLAFAAKTLSSDDA